ncbi:MAG TPA: PQQ-dependent sugar dehydrogenase [Candidatus Limnocylindria bacterium]|nr:PQQ-dependent sugar dehydrogenase [Candidatus Limnocylindria bacterium]
MKKRLLSFSSIALSLGLLASTTTRADDQPLPAQPGGKIPGNVAIQLVKVADGLVDPIHVASPNDGSGRLFVCERNGVVRIVKNGKVLAKPFLDIKDKTLSSFLEEGLYSIEFHPKFKENGLFYVSYADMWFNGSTMLTEYRVSRDNPDKADAESARVVMQLDFPYCNHHGGKAKFGPDGYLYIGVGDGGWEGDVINAGQDLHTWLGKMLRIDVNSRTSDRAYTIPQDNPFITPLQQMTLFGVSELQFSKIHPRGKPEIWAFGLRNPWTFSFDRQTGDLYIGDVGQNHWEEIDFQPAASKGGENYGWKMMGGSHPFPIELEKGAPRVGVLPIAEYSHVDQGICVVGIGIYRGKEYPSLNGVYFASDWGSGKVWGLKRDDAGKWQMQELLDLDTPLRPTGAGEDSEGNLYLTHATANYGGPVDPATSDRGAVWKIVSADKVPTGAEVAPLQK